MSPRCPPRMCPRLRVGRVNRAPQVQRAPPDPNDTPLPQHMCHYPSHSGIPSPWPIPPRSVGNLDPTDRSLISWEPNVETAPNRENRVIFLLQEAFHLYLQIRQTLKKPSHVRPSALYLRPPCIYVGRAVLRCTLAGETYGIHHLDVRVLLRCRCGVLSTIRNQRDLHLVKVWQFVAVQH